MEPKKPVRILITGANGDCLPPPYGGIIKRCLLHARAWKEMSAEVCMHVHHKHPNEEDLGAGADYFYDYIKKPNLIYKVLFVCKTFFSHPILFVNLSLLLLWLWPEKNIEILYYAGKGIVLNKKINTWKPTVIITECGSPQSICAAFIARNKSIPLVLENYAEMQFIADADGKNTIEQYAKAWKYLMNHCTMIVSASKHCTLGPKSHGAEENKLRIIYSGINFSIFNAPQDKTKSVLRESFSLPQNKYIIFAVGALKMRKGHDQLFESVLQLPKEILTKTAIALCGMGQADELKQKAIALGFPQESLFIFQGLTEERLAELYASADCFCFPSITPRECMGMAMKEAMAVGLPVTAYNTGGISEAITDGENGFLAPTNDRVALAHALQKTMLLSEEERSRMAKANIDKAQKLFDIRATSDQLFQILRTIALK